MTPPTEAAKQAIVAAAVEAGRAIQAVQDARVDWKEDGSPVTAADRASHDVLARALAEASDLPVLSEEGRDVPAAERRAWQSLWVVDPLDGTKEFIAGRTDYTVNVALVTDGAPVWGVVHVPTTGETFVGDVTAGRAVRRRNTGADETIHVAPPRDVPRVVVSKSHRNAATDAYLNQLGAHEAVSAGSSLKLCRVAAGEADLYPRLGPTMEWDTAAGDAVVRAAGGRVVGPDGNPLAYNKENLLNPFFLAAADPTRYPSLEVVA